MLLRDILLRQYELTKKFPEARASSTDNNNYENRSILASEIFQIRLFMPHLDIFPKATYCDHLLFGNK